MKLIFLNTWHGKIRQELADFIKAESSEDAIFCLQEVGGEAESLCAEIFTEHAVAKGSKLFAEGALYQSTYVHNRRAKIVSSEMIADADMDIGAGLYTHIMAGGTSLHVGNVHGLPQPGDKLDSGARIKQSEKFIEFFKEKDGAKIIGGDFNVLPETKSIRLFAEHGYRDLIKDFNIVTTRNRLAWKYPVKHYYSDYLFVSPEVRVTSFSVPQIEISDHLPLILDIEL
ncbi:MAG: hypothetical protein Q7S28_02805 [bacterium]|nr:hypothetical protein [bacterium]